jgi:PIN domain nuclease of toxin-antitoxin system
VTLLLDTRVLLWWRLDSRRLKRDVRNAVATADLVWVSAASGWEVAIKQRLGRLELADPFSTLVRGSGFEELMVTFAHAEQLTAMPLHHTDPFDRMLIAQALVEACTIVTHDRRFEPYDVPVLWV